jgi:hypothetical protein
MRVKTNVKFVIWSCSSKNYQRLPSPRTFAISKDIGLSIVFASRHYPNITIRWSENIAIDQREGHHADIASYVWNKLSCWPPTLKAELVDSIIARSSGIFLWVVLVVRNLNIESDRGINIISKDPYKLHRKAWVNYLAT